MSSFCEKIENHVNKCSDCKVRLQFDPVEKAMLNNNSFTNSVIELILYLVGALVLIYIFKTQKK